MSQIAEFALQMRATNTLLAYNLSRGDLSHWAQSPPVALEGLSRWVPLPSFERALAVFKDITSAQQGLLGLQQEWPHITIGYGPAMATNPSDVDYLQLPDRGKLLFVSPPVSPPAEWLQEMEEEPNTRVHYEQDLNAALHNALSTVQLQTELDQRQTDLENNASTQPLKVVLQEASSLCPGILVEGEGRVSPCIHTLPRSSCPSKVFT